MIASESQRLSGGLAYHVLNLIAAVLVIVGLVLCIRGTVLALGELGALYQGVGGDALATPEISEEDRSGRLTGHAFGALWGLVPVGVGATLFSVSRLLYKRKKSRSLDDRAIMHD